MASGAPDFGVYQKQYTSDGKVYTVGAAPTPTIYNVTMTDADTEYSQALPTNCKKFTIQTRDGTSFRIAFTTGKVAGPTAPYFTVPEYSTYNEDNLDLSDKTIYFACGSAGKIIELLAWSW